jgi:hypothetical protein
VNHLFLFSQLCDLKITFVLSFLYCGIYIIIDVSFDEDIIFTIKAAKGLTFV